MELQSLVRAATERPLSLEEAEAAFDHVMEGLASPVQVAALLVALRVRGPTPDEVAGGVRALRRAMVPVPFDDAATIVDTCGTGGGGVTTFNISTAAALVAAGAGVLVAKHGNRSFTSRSGSADVLEALGVRLELDPAREAEVLREVGIVFMFAPLHHPAMKHVGAVRRELAMPTVMNVLGPLTNPASASRQVVGVSDPGMMELIAGSLRLLGHRRALVVHGSIGLDELSPIGTSDVIELNGGALTRYTVDPARDLNWPEYELDDLAGGSPEENAEIVTAILKGERGGAARGAVTLNAGAAIYIADRAETLAAAVALAGEIIDSGAAFARLEALRAATND